MFSDSEDDDANGETLPPGQHDFDLDAIPDDEDELGDDDVLDEDTDEDLEEDSAFASSDEGDMEVDEANDPRTAHLRPNPIPDEDGAITTNLEDDLANEGFTLPAVETGGEVEDLEHGTSLREIEARMRWLVGVCAGKDDKVSQGVKGKSRSDHLLQLQHDIATYFGYNTFLVGKLMKLFPVDEVSQMERYR